MSDEEQVTPPEEENRTGEDNIDNGDENSEGEEEQ